MRDNDQQLIYNQAELGLIQAVFAENDELVYAVRNVLLQIATPEDWALVRTQIKPEVVSLLRRKLLDNMRPHAPLRQLWDLSASTSSLIKQRSVEDMAPIFAAVKLEKEYLEQQLLLLEGGGNEENIKLADLGVIGDDHYQNYVNSTARCTLVAFVEQEMVFVRSLAGSKEETMEKKLKRLQRDSNQ